MGIHCFISHCCKFFSYWLKWLPGDLVVSALQFSSFFFFPSIVNKVMNFILVWISMLSEWYSTGISFPLKSFLTSEQILNNLIFISYLFRNNAWYTRWDMAIGFLWIRFGILNVCWFVFYVYLLKWCLITTPTPFWIIQKSTSLLLE